MLIRAGLRLAAAAVLLGGSAWGGTIIAESISGTSGSSGGILAVSWAQSGSFTNVSVSAVLASDNGQPGATGTAYLMNLIGPSASAANEVTAPNTSISVGGNNSLTEDLLFSGLSLGPGTYFLVIVPTDFNQVDSLDWDLTNPGSVALGGGVTQNSDEAVSTTPAGFGPASTFATQANRQLFLVTGDASQNPPPPNGAPEPSTIATMAGGLIWLGVSARRRAGRA
jgi:hypothetical protein